MKFLLITVITIVVVALINVIPAGSAACALQPSITGIVEDATSQNAAQRTMKINFKLTNPSNKGVCFCEWFTLFDDHNWAPAVGLSVNGRPKNYDTPVMPYHSRVADGDFIFIAATSSVPIQRDLSEVFKLAKDVKYGVEVRTYPLDCREVDNEKDCTRRLATDFTLKEFAKVFSSFTPTKEIAKTEYPSIEDWLKRQPTIKVTGKMATLGASDKQHNGLKNAHALSKTFLTDALTVLFLTNVEEKQTNLYEKWFGHYDKMYFDKVLGCFAEMNELQGEVHVYNIVKGTDLCPPGGEAFVWALLRGKKQHLINICEETLLKGLDFENKKVWEYLARTIVHERSHDTCGTSDEKISCQSCYGPYMCKELASIYRPRAANNADNYALFSKAAYWKETLKLKELF